jgi:serine/threonine-protein kinase
VPGYEVLGELGRGGMGVVYRARDTRLDRPVAVKTLLPGAAAIGRAHARLLAEAGTVARLPHPGIAPVHEAGTVPDGRPFFAMKLVEGRTLAAHLAERPNPGHDRPRFLAVFEQVCQAVGYAHSKGIVHRDLKPANVMVGAFGEVQVMDWGLAKDLVRSNASQGDRLPGCHGGVGDDPASLSLPGSVAGTPAYMPPEQARGEAVDERADVFGLGGILCEVLTRRPVYPNRDARAALAQAERGDLGETFARLDGCGADAELVQLAKSCLAAERDARPRDGGAVAGAVGAYLAGVQERLRQAELDRAAAQARAGEERRRRRWQAVGALLLAALAGGGWWVSLDRAERRHQEGLLAAAERARAGERDAAVGRALEAVAGARDAGRWLEARTVLEQAESRMGEDGPPELRGRLRQARADLDAAQALEDARMSGAAVSGGRFDSDAVWRGYAAALARYGLTDDLPPEELAARVRGSAVAGVLVATLDELAVLHPDPAARARLRATAALADPDGWRGEVLRALAAGDRAAVERLAWGPGADGQPAASLVLLARALGSEQGDAVAAGLLRRARQDHPEDFWVHHDLGACLTRGRPPSPAEAEAGYRAALALRPQSAGAHNNLGNLLADQPRRAAEAEWEYHAAIRLRPDYAEPHNNLGVLLGRRPERVAEAEREYRDAIRLRPDLAEAHGGLGTMLAAQPDKLAEAEAEFRTAVRLRPESPVNHNHLGIFLSGRPGKAAAAEAELRAALRLQPDYANAHANLGHLLSRQPGRGGEAEAEYRAALRLRPDDARTHYNLGALLDRQLDRQADAEAAYREALRLQPDDAEAHCNLGFVLRRQGRFAEALAELRQGHELGSRLPGWRYDSAQWVRGVGQQAALEARLPAILSGSERPAGPAEAQVLTQVAQLKSFYTLAARAATDALTDPRLAEDLASAHRFTAACWAVLAAAGRGNDAERLPAKARAGLRRQALEWLRADLAARARLITPDHPQREAARQSLRNWQGNANLASVRDEPALAALPPTERAEWTTLWADVANLVR